MNHELDDILLRQLDEINLIRCSLLPGEILILLDDTQTWNDLLDAHTTGKDHRDSPLLQVEPALPRLQLKLESANAWFEVNIPHNYSGNLQTCRPTFSVKGENLSRTEQERWQHIIEGKIDEIADTDVSTHLVAPASPSSSSLAARSTPSISPSHGDDLVTTSPSYPYHALFTSHHLVSPNKRRSLQQWSSSLSITGFAKIGYPGIIYAQGQQQNLEEFVANVKAMQWLALKARFVEPIDMVVDGQEGQWREFQKVGEVVEEMRRIGRERHMVEMGIGSA